MKLSRPSEKLILVLAITLTLVGAANTGDHGYRIIHRFRAGSDGLYPSGIAAGKWGTLWGTTQEGGTYKYGTIFRLIPPKTRGGKWIKTVVYNLPSQADSYPFLGTIGQEDPRRSTELYGFAYSDSIWKLTYMKHTRPQYSMLYTLNGGTDGAGIQGITLGPGGNLYGATEYGGDLGCDRGYGCGTVFQLKQPTTKGGKWHFNVLYWFTGNPDGALPIAGVMLDRGANLYGPTSRGGSYDWGAVYRVSPPKKKGQGWTETVLYSFDANNGIAVPFGPMTFDSSGNLYGTAAIGGGFDCGGVFELSPPARKGKDWTYATLYVFTGGTDGCYQGGFGDGNLVVDHSGNLYGTTPEGGDAQGGTVFRLSPPTNGGGQWTETTLHSFTDKNGDGGLPGGVTWGKWGDLYGVTYEGGGTGCYSGFGCGTVFEVRP